MSTLKLSESTFQRLQDRAKRQNCSIEELLDHFLDEAPIADPLPYRDMLNHSSDIIALFDLEFRHLYINSAIKTIMGLSPQEMIGKTNRELGMPEDQVVSWENIQLEVRKTRQEQVITFDFPASDGQRFYETRLSPIFDRNNRIQYISGITRDITERKKAGEALHKSRHNLQALIENSDGSIWSVDTQYRLIVGNALFYQSVAAAGPKEVTPGTSLLSLNMPQDVLDEWRDYYDRALRGEKFIIEVSTHFANPPREMEYRFNPIKDDSGQIVGAAVFTGDITERNRAQDRLQRSEANLRAMFNSTRQSFTLIDRDYHIVDIDDKGKKSSATIFGKPMHTGDSIYDFVLDRDKESFTQNFIRALNGEQVVVEKTFKNLQGGDLYFEIVYYPVIDQTGETIGVCMSSQNITEQRLSQEALRKSEEDYRLLAQNVTDMISKHTPEGVYTFVTPLAQRLLGYMPEDLIGHSAYEFFHPDDLQSIQQAHQTIIEQPVISIVEYRIRRHDGQYIWFETTSHIIKDGVTGQDIEIVAVSRDISERKRAEEALRQSESRLRLLLATQTAFVVRSDLTGHYTYVNPAFAKRYQWLSDNLIGHRLIETVLPEDHEKTMAAAQACLQSPGQSVQVVLRKTAPDHDPFWTLWEFVAIQNADGAVTEIQCIGFDITQQRQAEEFRLEQERLKTNLRKEKEFNVLIQKAVSMLSHDIRIPLTVIAMAKDILENYSDRINETVRQEKLSSISRQLHYVVELLNEVTMTVKGNLDAPNFKPEIINLEALCQICIREIQETSGSKHHLVFTTDGRITTARIDETLINRILLNLLTNAVKFSPEASEICLDMNQQNDWIVLRVIDHGIGISVEALPHIFEPFYRTESVQHIQGTGLGLNIVRECVHQHHGFIAVASVIGQGTTFTVKLPIL